MSGNYELRILPISDCQVMLSAAITAENAS